MPERATAASYDRVARRYADEIGGELAERPLERGLLAAFAELVGAGGSAVDLGCGPGHVSAHLAGLGLDLHGLDLSPGMVAVARERYPEISFEVGSMLDLPWPDSSLDGAVAVYSVIHLDPAGRAAAYAEAARVVRPGGRLLVGFHESGTSQLGTFAAGEVATMTTWWDEPVELDFYHLDPATETAALAAAGWVVTASLEREPDLAGEAATRRCYLLAERRSKIATLPDA